MQQIVIPNQLSPTIFNVVFDAFIRHWAKVVPPSPQESAGQEGLGMSIQALMLLFYADEGLVASPKSA